MSIVWVPNIALISIHKSINTKCTQVHLYATKNNTINVRQILLKCFLNPCAKLSFD